jgi:hypothetical protein
MADIKFLLPEESSGNLKEDFENLKTKFISVLKELEYALGNLDEENVQRAASVRAEDIDTSKAKIRDAQIKSLTADKLTAGTIDANEISVINIDADNISAGSIDTDMIKIASGDGSLVMDGGLIRMYDEDGALRLMMGLDTRSEVGGEANPYYNQFCFFIVNKDGVNTIYFDDDGNAVFAGKINTKNSVSVGKRIEMQNSRDSRAGLYFMSGSDCLGSVSIDGETPGVYISAQNGVYINGSKIATESYVNKMFGGV